MFEQMMDSFRRASQSSLQMQQDFLRMWTQGWLSMPSGPSAGTAPDFGQGFQRRWLDLLVELMNQHRESLDQAYKAGIGAIDQTFRVSEAKSPEDYRRMTEELWRKLFETFKTQSETQWREFQKWSGKAFSMAQSAPV